MHKIIFDYTSSEFSNTFVHDLASCLVHFIGVPLGYYSHFCTTKVSQSIIMPGRLYRFLLCFLNYRSLWNMRNYIHCMLCGSMFTAELLFTVGINRTENEVL